MSFIICLLRARGLHSDPYLGDGGSGPIWHCRTALPMSTPVLWLTWVECHSPSLDLGFGRVSCRGWRYSG